MTGRYTGEEMIIYTLVLPSVCIFVLILFACGFNCRGDSQGRLRIITLVLPSMNRLSSCFYGVFLLFHVGEITQVGVFILNILVLPSMNRNIDVFLGYQFNPILWSFCGHQFSHGLSIVWWYTQWRDPHIMYIYSLGHFLTTKGALIDGDWGGSKNDQKLT